MKLEVDLLPAEVTSLITPYPEIKEEVLDGLFYEKYLPKLKEMFPNLELIIEEKISLSNGETALYAVLNMPQAANVPGLNKRNLDSKRGYLLTFSNDSFLVNFCLQDTLSLVSSSKSNGKEKKLEDRLLQNLLSLQKTFLGCGSFD